MADILVIDDMASVRLAIAAMLRRAGHKVQAAGSGDEGLRLAAQHRFDLVVTDILMPGLDGTEVVSQLCAQQNRPAVIAMSGGGGGVSPATALRAAGTMADAFLEKPFGRDELLATIQRLVPRAA